MRETFVFEDLLNTLIRLEEKGHRVYSQAAGTADTPAIRELLEGLAAAEARHKALFEEMKRHEETMVGSTPEDADPEYREYLDVLLASHIGLPTLDRGAEDAETVLREALALEKETLLFLAEAERVLSSEAGQKKLNAVADEERGHIRAIHKTATELGVSLKLP